EPAVPVIVDPGGARSEAGVADAGGLRHVLERPVTAVAEQVIGPEGVEVEVLVAVVVVVGGGRADGVRLDLETRLRGGVLEGAVAAVAIEGLERRLAVVLRPLIAVDEADV